MAMAVARCLRFFLTRAHRACKTGGCEGCFFFFEKKKFVLCPLSHPPALLTAAGMGVCGCVRTAPLGFRNGAIRRWYILSVDTSTPSRSSCLVTSPWEEARGSAVSPNLSGEIHFKVSECGGALAVSKFEAHLRTDQDLNDSLLQLSGARLVCHCRPGEDCHADITRTVFREQFPDAHDRNEEHTKPRTAQVLNMAKLREVPEQSDASSADGGAPEKSRMGRTRTTDGSWCRPRLTRTL